jgi:hypothetical protein
MTKGGRNDFNHALRLAQGDIRKPAENKEIIPTDIVVSLNSLTLSKE